MVTVNEMIMRRVFEVLKYKANSGDRDAGFIIAMIETSNNGKEEVREINKERFKEILYKLTVNFKTE